jgi:hypothetical protein
MRLLKQSTTVTVIMGPALDKTDGVTEETALSPAVEVSKAGAAFGARSSATAISHDQNGWYRVELNGTDTNTLGPLVVKFDDAATHLPVWHEFVVLAANIYDALVANSDKLQTDLVEWLGGAPNALSSGRVDAHVGAMATGVQDGIVDKVWDEDVDASHQTAGSAGKKLDDAGAAADPWTTALPGAYGQGTAGHILGYTRQRAGTAQGGAAGSITLDAGASASDDFYNNTIVQIVSGTGAGQSRIVADYTGATKVAAVNGNWVVAPDNTSVFVIYPFGSVPGASAPTAAQVADAVWDEAVADHQTAGSAGKVLSTRVTGGAGALQRTIGVTVGGSPLEGASVWVATDAAGTNVVAGPLVTSSGGSVTLLLDAGTYYVWVQKDGHQAIVGQAISVA